MLTHLSYKYTFTPLDDNYSLLSISLGLSQAMIKIKKLTQTQTNAVKAFLEDTAFWVYFLRQMNRDRVNPGDFCSVLTQAFLESLPPDVFLKKDSSPVAMPFGLVLLLTKTIDFIVDK